MTKTIKLYSTKNIFQNNIPAEYNLRILEVINRYEHVKNEGALRKKAFSASFESAETENTKVEVLLKLFTAPFSNIRNLNFIQYSRF